MSAKGLTGQGGSQDRIVGAVVEAITPIINMLGARIDEVRGDVKGIRDTVQETREHVVAQNGAVAALKEKTIQHDKAISNLPCHTHAGKMVEMEGTMSELGKKIDQLLGTRTRTINIIVGLVLAVTQGVLIWAITRLIQALSSGG